MTLSHAERFQGRGRTTRNGCVYLIAVPSGAFKIGIGRNPVARTQALQTGNHEPITFIGATLESQNGVDAREMERVLHKALSRHRAHGEWFSGLDLEKVLDLWASAWRACWMNQEYAPKRAKPFQLAPSG